MNSNNRRKADRLDVGIPVQLRTRDGSLAAEIVDLSRTGLRVWFPISSVPGEPGAAPRRAGEMLSPNFELEINYEQLGPLLNKSVKPIRVGIPSDAPDMIEVCCEFEGVFEDEESGYLDLGSPLPPMRDSVDVWVEVEQEPEPIPEPAPPVQPILKLPRRRYRALVSGLKPSAPPAFFCHTDMVTRTGVRVRLKRGDAGIPHGEQVSVSKALSTLIARYGAELDLRIVDPGGDIWRGPSHFSGLELPRNQPDALLVTLAFGRRLSLAELRRLELVGEAA